MNEYCFAACFSFLSLWAQNIVWLLKQAQTWGVTTRIFLNFTLINKKSSCFFFLLLLAIRGAASPTHSSECVQLGGMRAPCERRAAHPGLPPKHETRALTCCPGTSPPDPAAWRTTSRSSESLYPSNIWRSRRDSQQADINEQEQDQKTSIQNLAAGFTFHSFVCSESCNRSLSLIYGRVSISGDGETASGHKG